MSPTIPRNRHTANDSRASRNATSHGITARTLTLRNENPDHFLEILNAYFEYFKPSNQIEVDLIAEMVAARNSTTINPGEVDVAVFPPISVQDWTVETLPERIAEIRQLYLDTLKDWPHGDVPRPGLYTRKRAPAKKTARKASPKTPAKTTAKAAAKKSADAPPAKKAAAKKTTKKPAAKGRP